MIHLVNVEQFPVTPVVAQIRSAAASRTAWSRPVASLTTIRRPPSNVAAKTSDRDAPLSCSPTRTRHRRETRCGRTIWATFTSYKFSATHGLRLDVAPPAGCPYVA